MGGGGGAVLLLLIPIHLCAMCGIPPALPSPCPRVGPPLLPYLPVPFPPPLKHLQLPFPCLLGPPIPPTEIQSVHPLCMACPSCVTLRRVVVPLRGPEQSPVLPFTCCVGLLLSVGCCGLCSCWCRFRIRGAQ